MADQTADRDREFWGARARSVAALAAADAVAVVLPLPDGRYVSFAGHNLPADASWLEGAPQYLVWTAVRHGTAQRRAETAVTLADGKVARSLVAVPVPWNERVIGALVLLRGAPTYDEAAGASAEELARLIGLELAVSSLLQRGEAQPTAARDDEVKRANEDRRHAIALYELGRLALRRSPASAAGLLADSLGYAVVGVWDLDGATLRLADAHGYGGAAAPVSVENDATLRRVIRDGSAQRAQRGANGARPWMGPAREAIAAPLGDGRGVLVVGDPRDGFTAADLALAPSLAEAVGLVRAALALPAAGETPALAPATPAATAPAPVPEPAPATAPAAAAPAPRARRAWVLPLFLLALAAAAVGAVLTEPLVFVLAGLLLLVALWGWLA